MKQYVPHRKCAHKAKHTKNNYSAANTACNPLKPHEAGQSQHSSMVLTLFCHAALLALPTASPPLFSAAQSQPGDDTEKPRDNFKYSIFYELSSICGRSSKPGTIFTFMRKASLLCIRQSRGYIFIFIYLSLRAKPVHKSDHRGWNVGQNDFSLKCIF